MIPEELTERLLDFGVAVGKVADSLPETPFGQHVAYELVQSGAAAGPSYEEAVAAERRGEFTRQLNDALADLRDARYWLRLAAKADFLPESRVRELVGQCTELCGILEQSIATARARAWREGQFRQWQATDLQFTMYALPFATISMGFRRPPGRPDAAASPETPKPDSPSHDPS
ncbi:MAG TPA: four helix bundle protein [Phycisphaerae bacterium]|nr:four helix bundle protein [Phycisphaerae bacterium]